jgi:uncharacterized protein (TIGR03086 family)
MSHERATAALIGGIGLLERAINYTLGSLRAVTPEALSRPTPCTDWDLRDLLTHLNDSMAALHEAVDEGAIGLRPRISDPHDDPVAVLRNRACQLLGAWTGVARERSIVIGGHPLTTGIVTSAGAIEVAVHGWDVARACGEDRPIPPLLAAELLDLSMLFVAADDRPARFGHRIRVPAYAPAADRLLGFLGRESPVRPRCYPGG